MSRANPSVHNQQDQVRLADGDPGLAQDLPGDHVPVLGNDPSGVDELDFPGIKVGPGINPIASNARLVAYDGLAAPYQAVEKRGLPDIGTAHDCNPEHLLANRLPAFWNLTRQSGSPASGGKSAHRGNDRSR